MKQITFNFDTIGKATDALKQISEDFKDITPSKILLHIYVSGMSSKKAKELLKFIEAYLPGIPRVGISEYQAYADKRKYQIKLNFIVADESYFYSYQIPCKRGLEKDCADNFVNMIKNVDNVKAIEICSANQLIDTSSFIESLGGIFNDLPIFGALSKPARIVENKIEKVDDSFSIGSKIFSDGFTIVVYSGENIDVYLNYIQSWHPIGKEMHLRLKDNVLLGSSAVNKIDNAPAINTYNKYLGIPKDDTFIDNAWYFPLITNRNGINICFTPMGRIDDTLFFNGRLFEYEPIRFSYCTRDEILDASFDDYKKIKTISPDALIVINCCNRYAFLRGDDSDVFEYYRKCVDGFTYCHAYGEIAYKNMKGGVLNSALVSISFKEGERLKNNKLDFYITPQRRKFKQSTIPISFIISHFFNQMTNELLSYQDSLEDKVSKIIKDNENLSLQIIQALTETIDAKDKYTNGHSRRVAEYTREIAKRCGYKRDELLNIYLIALLHDIGKICVPDFIINKTSKLTKEEYDIVKQHSILGAHILSKIQNKPDLVLGARWHHERYDGFGYPDGLKGKDIPEIARIIAVADAYDAMTSNRSYREALPQKYVRFEIAKERGKQFDPIFADIMLKMIDNDAEYKLREAFDSTRDRNEGMDFTTSALMSNYPEAALSMRISEYKEGGRHLSFSLLVDFGESMPGGFFVYKAGGKEELLYVNNIVLQMFGCNNLEEFRELTDYTFRGMVHKNDIERVELSIIEQIEKNDNKLDYVEYRICRKDGNIRWVDDYGRLVSTVEYGDVFYVLIRDITDEHFSREKATSMDHLTQVFNRRYFDDELKKNISHIMRHGGNLCLIMIDIDKFKQFNDLYGHFSGDKCLSQVAHTMRNSLKRKTDVLCRYGGEEFAVILPGAILEDASLVAEKLRRAVRDIGLPHEGGPCGIVTISAGVALLTGDDAKKLNNPAGQLIELADKGLYEAKEKGRNIVIVNRFTYNDSD